MPNRNLQGGLTSNYLQIFCHITQIITFRHELVAGIRGTSFTLCYDAPCLWVSMQVYSKPFFSSISGLAHFNIGAR